MENIRHRSVACSCGAATAAPHGNSPAAPVQSGSSAAEQDV